MKYSVHIPWSVREAFRLDEENGNTLWSDALSKEILVLQKMNCFKVVDDERRWHPARDGYQYAPLQMIFDIKPDSRRKARLVAGGHVVKCDVNTYASKVKSLSVKLLHVIADANGLWTLCGDIGNAFVNSYTNEKIYTQAGPEFGPTLQGKTMLIVKSLYGLQSLAERWRAHFASTLQSMGFVSLRADQDVWIRKRDDNSGYDYICTHVDDFSIFAKDPDAYMSVIKDLYVVRDIGPPKYYLGTDFFRDTAGKAYMGSSTYVTEAVRKVEKKVGILWKERSPCAEGDQPELDTSLLLDTDNTRLFQNLIGVAQWIAQLGRFDIAQAINLLSCFSAAPCQGHLDRAICIFAYLKRQKHMSICIDSRPLLIDHGLVHSHGELDFSAI
jgi:Reverse transcriptase (RNA-dependent DNA polymerase)